MVKEGDNWNILQKADLEDRYRIAGMRDKKHDGEFISPIRAEILRVQQERKINGYCQQIPGYESGIHTFGTERICVQREITLPVGKPGDYSFITEMLAAVFGNDPDHPQAQLFEGYCANRYRKLSNPNECKLGGQMLILVGPKSSGKSRTQEDLISPLLGGSLGHNTAPDFIGHLLKGERFTEALQKSNHWCSDDVAGKVDRIADQEGLMREIKNAVWSTTIEWRNMHCPPFTTEKRVAISLSLNTENKEVAKVIPENVLADGTSDKFLMLAAFANGFPFPDAGDPAGVRAYQEKIKAALPGWIDYLQHRYVAPPGYENNRTLVAGYCHPIIRDQLIPEKYKEITDAIVEKTRRGVLAEGKPFRGNATDLNDFLDLPAGWRDPKTGEVGTRLGKALMTLSVQPILRDVIVQPDRAADTRLWQINAMPRAMAGITPGPAYLQE
jgi:hypothetical protein